MFVQNGGTSTLAPGRRRRASRSSPNAPTRARAAGWPRLERWCTDGGLRTPGFLHRHQGPFPALRGMPALSRPPRPASRPGRSAASTGAAAAERAGNDRAAARARGRARSRRPRGRTAARRRKSRRAGWRRRCAGPSARCRPAPARGPAGRPAPARTAAGCSARRAARRRVMGGGRTQCACFRTPARSARAPGGLTATALPFFGTGLDRASTHRKRSLAPAS